MITPYVIISAVTAVLAVVVAVIAWGRRAAPGGRPLMALMLAVAVWSAGAALEYAAVGIPGKLIWAKYQYWGVVTVPVCYLLLALEYCQLTNWLTWRRIAALLIVPAITVLLAFTNDWHGLIWPNILPAGAPADNLAIYEHGIGFWLGSVGYSYLLMAIATVLLLRAALRLPDLYRRQAYMLVTAALAPWIVNLIYVAGLSPVPGLEMTPLVLVVTGMIFAWGMLRLHLLDLTPVARATLVETMADGMVVLDAFDRVVDINPAAQRYIGAATLVQLGAPAATVFAGWFDWASSCAGTHDVRLELVLREPAPRNLALTLTPFHDGRGRYSGRVLIIHDITAYKAAQQEIELLNRDLEARVAARTQDLAASQERFRQVIDSISDYVFALRVKPDGVIEWLYNSPRLKALTGFEGTELAPDFMTAFFGIVHPEDCDAVMAVITHMFEQDTAEIECRLVRADGSTAWVHTSMRAQWHGTDRTIFAVTSDITVRKQMENIAAEARALAELDILRTELVSNVSHELRTPLGLIKVASTTLQRPDVDFPPEIQQQILRSITEEADRLDLLVADLLDISRLEQKRFFLQREPTDMNQLLTVIVEAMHHAPGGAAGNSRRFVLDLPGSPVVATIDASKIEQVVRNLLQNAVNYSPEGSSITVTLGADEEACELRVTDEGIGITPEEQIHIFDRFYRGRDARAHRVRGTGLGLAISREIVAAHGGTIRVESAPEQGATFITRLPRQASLTADLHQGDDA